jgi:ATP-dependent RNA helicase DDX21
MSKNRKFVDLIKSYDIKTPTTIEHICLKMDNSVRTLNQVITNLITIYAGAAGSVIIFCETKREANDLGATLNLKQCTNVLHGDIPQHMREETFKNFKSGFVRCLIATNVAARGLDIPSVDLIVQL